MSLMVPFLAQNARERPQRVPRWQHFWFLLHNGHYIRGDIFLVHDNFINKFREPAVSHHQVTWLILLLAPGILHTPFGGFDFRCCINFRRRWSFSFTSSLTGCRVFLEMQTRVKGMELSQAYVLSILLTKQGVAIYDFQNQIGIPEKVSECFQTSF